MAGCAELRNQFLFQFKPAMIRGNSYAHTITFFLGQFEACFVAARSRFMAAATPS